MQQRIAALSRLLVLLSPIRCIFTELLIEIFNNVVNEFSLDFDDYARQMTTIMLVCRHWRDVCAATPEFWNRMVCGSFSTSAGLDVWLQRSQATPICLELKVNIHSEFASLPVLQKHATRFRVLTFHLDDKIIPHSNSARSEDTVIRVFDSLVNRSTSIEELSVHGELRNDYGRDHWHFELRLPKLRTLTWNIWRTWDSANLPDLQWASFLFLFPSPSMLRDVSSVESLVFNALHDVATPHSSDTNVHGWFPRLKSVFLFFAQRIKRGHLLAAIQSVNTPITAYFEMVWRTATVFDTILNVGIHERITEIYMCMHLLKVGYRDSSMEYPHALRNLLKKCSPTLRKLYFETKERRKEDREGRVTVDLPNLLQEFLIPDDAPAVSPLCPKLRELHLTEVTLPLDTVSRIAGQRSDQPNPFSLDTDNGLVFRPCRVFIKRPLDQSMYEDINSDTWSALSVGDWGGLWRHATDLNIVPVATQDP